MPLRSIFLCHYVRWNPTGDVKEIPRSEACCEGHRAPATSNVS